MVEELRSLGIDSRLLRPLPIGLPDRHGDREALGVKLKKLDTLREY